MLYRHGCLVRTYLRTSGDNVSAADSISINVTTSHQVCSTVRPFFAQQHLANGHKACRRTAAGVKSDMGRPLTSSSTLSMAAWSYTNAMRLILPTIYDEGSHNLGGPYGLLSGFALELGLKSVLRAAGASDKQLGKVSHDLQAALAAAIDSGLVLSNPKDVNRIIDLMQPVHKDHLMRYIPADVEFISMPDPSFVLDVTVSLLDDIKRQVPDIMEFMPS
jgi:hypothetical protein